MSSIQTPRLWTAQSLTYEIETVTSWPAYVVRSNSHSVQPRDRPDAAFQPAPEQSAPWYWMSRRCSGGFVTLLERSGPHPRSAYGLGKHLLSGRIWINAPFRVTHCKECAEKAGLRLDFK